MSLYYAYCEKAESVSGERHIILDCITKKDLSHLERWKHQGGDKSYPDTHIFQLYVEATPDQLRDSWGRHRIVEERWYSVEIGKSGLTARRFEGIDQIDSTSIKALVRPLSPSGNEVKRIRAALTHRDPPPELSEDEIINLKTPKTTGHHAKLIVYNVGQGSCAALCRIDGRPVLFFDFGGGCLQHSGSYPSHKNFSFDGNTSIVLSHWDMDHWSGAMRHVAAKHLQWIAPPLVNVGPTLHKFTSELLANGRLKTWPQHIASINSSSATYLRCTGKNRNNSGIAVIAKVNLGYCGEPCRSPLRVLLPGDANYSSIPGITEYSLDALVATHHGGNFFGKPPIPSGSADKKQVIFSYGQGNYFKHPTMYALKSYRKAGWQLRHDSPNGDLKLTLACGPYDTCSGCLLFKKQS